MTVAANLKRLRLDRQLSQGRLAELANVSQQLVSQIERGENVSTKYLPQIAVALNCKVDELDPSYRVTEPAQDQLIQEIVALASQLSEQERRLLLGAAQGLLSVGRPEG
jgi:transcriptional regulator with XRE-family HTH domain